MSDSGARRRPALTREERREKGLADLAGQVERGFDRLRDALLRQRERPSRRSRVLAAAQRAQQPDVPLDQAHALATDSAGVSTLRSVGRGVYWRTRVYLEAHGEPSLVADRIARRCAGMVTLEHAGFARSEAARALGVSDRQARRDRALLASLDRGELADSIADGELLPPVPGRLR
jgi:hypothetical protein